MLRLHRQYFDNVRPETFFSDMSEKDWIIILEDSSEIVGFSTLQVFRADVRGRERVFLFSGDTIVDRKHWLNSKLAGSFGHFMLRLLDEFPDTPLYWFLISKGYRTYRFLPVYFREFFPVHDKDTPPEYSDLIAAAATQRFNGAYDINSGLIRAGAQGDRLKPGMCDVPHGRETDPHVQFFLDKNPGYAAGDELACIANISKENLNRFAWRVIEQTKVTWHD